MRGSGLGRVVGERMRNMSVGGEKGVPVHAVLCQTRERAKGEDVQCECTPKEGTLLH